jgi:hypothetical protein
MDGTSRVDFSSDGVDRNGILAGMAEAEAHAARKEPPAKMTQSRRDQLLGMTALGKKILSERNLDGR